MSDIVLDVALVALVFTFQGACESYLQWRDSVKIVRQNANDLEHLLGNERV